MDRLRKLAQQWRDEADSGLNVWRVACADELEAALAEMGIGTDAQMRGLLDRIEQLANGKRPPEYLLGAIRKDVAAWREGTPKPSRDNPPDGCEWEDKYTLLTPLGAVLFNNKAIFVQGASWSEHIEYAIAVWRDEGRLG